MNEINTHRSDKSWRLILVGNHGSIIPLGTIKALLVVLIASLVLTFVSAGILGVLYARQKVDYSAMVRELDQQQEQLQIMRDKRDMLMARLVIAESKLNTGGDSEQIAPAESPPEATTSERAPAAEPEKKEEPAKSPAEATPPISVAISDFKISHSLSSNEISASYSLRNTTPGNKRIGGKCVLLLKGSIRGEATTYPIPEVPWENGLPSGKLGRPFFIRNFMTIKMNRTAPNQSFKFDRGIVYVFEMSGKVIHKKEIPLDLSYTKETTSPEIETSTKNSKDSGAAVDIKDDTPVEVEPQTPANEPASSESTP